MARLVLASSSPRRRELLASMGFDFDVEVPDVDESVVPGELPDAYVGRVATAKATAVVERLGGDPGRVVVAADTTVELDGVVLGKPTDDTDARAMLTSLSGRTHRVHTGLVVAHDDIECVVVTTEVEFDRLDQSLVDWYVATGEPFDKAGSYAIQGRGAVLVRAVRGSVSNVVGLPLAELRALLLAAGSSL